MPYNAPHRTFGCIALCLALCACAWASEPIGNSDPGPPAPPPELSKEKRERAEDCLGQLATRIKEAYKEADPGFERFFTTDGKSAHLRPVPRRRALYGNLNVARAHPATSIPAATLDPGTAFAYLLRPFARCDSLKLSFDVLDVDPTGGGPFASTVAYHAFGQAPGVNIEQHAVWRITWLQEITASSISPDHPPHSFGKAKIQEIRVLEMADTTAPSQQFSDCTRSVLVRDEDWFPLLAYGADHWHGRLDAVCGHDASGLEGIAVGDVNGDGLDDLYVAQGAGLSNRLFVQQGDGTAIDTASEAGVDWLDVTAGVLLADLDDDDDEDLLCALGSRIVLCRNDGRARFTPERVHEVPSSQGPLGFAAEDADADGDLDVRVTIGLRERLHVIDTSITPDSEHGERTLLMRNDGTGRFKVISSSARADPTAHDEGLQWPADVRVDFGNDGFEDLITPFGGLTFRQRIRSGDHKRLAGFLNLESGLQVAGPGTEEFIDVSALLGLDLPDDGMAFAVTDWDGDGQLDLWLRNRSGPQLRFLRNVGTPQHHWLALKLTGKTCNRDAVRAGVTVRTGERSITRQVEPGDGYLSQSSKWLHFGLGTAQKADRIEVRWPDGMIEEFVNLPADARYLLTQGTPQPVPVAQRSVRLADAPFPKIGDNGTVRIVLEIPIPIPPSMANLALDKSGPDRPVLLHVWAHRALWSRGQMAILAQEYERIRDQGLEVLALNVDGPAQREEAIAFLEQRVLPKMSLHRFREQPAPANVAATLAVIVGQVCGEPEVRPEPVTLLLDPDGSVQVIYRGHVEIEQIIKDAEDYAGQSRPQGHRGMSTGRWFSPPKRDGSELAERLKNAGFVEEAEFYMSMARSIQP